MDSVNTNCKQADPDGVAPACCSVVALGGLSISLRQAFSDQTLTFHASQSIANGTVTAQLITSSKYSSFISPIPSLPFHHSVSPELLCSPPKLATLEYIFSSVLFVCTPFDCCLLSGFLRSPRSVLTLVGVVDPNSATFASTLSWSPQGQDPVDVSVDISLWMQGRNSAVGNVLVCATL